MLPFIPQPPASSSSETLAIYWMRPFMPQPPADRSSATLTAHKLDASIYAPAPVGRSSVTLITHAPTCAGRSSHTLVALIHDAPLYAQTTCWIHS